MPDIAGMHDIAGQAGESIEVAAPVVDPALAVAFETVGRRLPKLRREGCRL